MSFALRIARRYLFAKKSTNAINVITGIAVFGISIGTAALIIVLSVFNGFEDLLTGMFNSFNPDIKITAIEGKTFEVDSIQLEKIKKIDGVAAISQSLEELAFFEYEGNQDFGILKGVDLNYLDVIPLDSVIREDSPGLQRNLKSGNFRLKDAGKDLALLGLGMRNKLAVGIDEQSMISVYMAKQKSGFAGDAFRRKFIYPSGSFMIQQDYDNQYVIASLDFARSLMKKPTELSSLELKVKTQDQIATVKAELQGVLGSGVRVEDRLEQDKVFRRLMNLEKWLFYTLFSLALILVAFNIVGALFMIVLDKQKDITMLKAMGTTDQEIRRIFLYEGLLLSALGILIGLFIGVVLYVLQKTIVIVSIPPGFIVDAYPIQLRFIDFIVVSLTVLLIGWLASIPASRRAGQSQSLIRAD